MAKAFRSKSANLLVYVLVGLLVLGLAGFGIGNFTSTVQSIGSVGDEEITVQEYAQVLQGEINRFQARTGQVPSLFEIQQFGLDQVALRGVVLNASLDNEANRIGVSVGDKTVVEELRQSDRFKGTDGAFDVSAYEFALERLGLTAGEYDDIIREEKTRLLLQQAAGGSLQVPDAYTETLMSYFLEKRTFEWADMAVESVMSQVSEVSDAEVKAFYDEHEANFTVPETKQITYAWLTPDMIADQASVSDSEVRDLFEEKSSIYVVPERRIVERLVFSSRSAAEAALSRIESGAIDFEGLIQEKGLTPEDVNLGTVEREELALEGGEVVFALTEPGIAGPAESKFGPALFNVLAVLNAQATEFESVRAELEAELALENARLDIADSLEDIEDRLAAGATLEELAAETDMQLASIDFNSDSEGEIAEFFEFRQVAEAVDASDFPELSELDNGGVFAIRLDGVLPPRLKPLSEVRSEAETEAFREKARKLAIETAENFESELEGGKSFADLDLTTNVVEEAQRTFFEPGVPFGLVAEIFKLESGESAVFEHGSGVALARLETIHAYDLDSAEALDTKEGLEAQAGRELGLNAFHIYADAIRFDAGMSLDQAIIDAVHAQLQ
ncbi:MAG: SurA N-terminal domain-containing protein [Albidovulum sp.]|nr:SurA N-terminal domain-containing protein [Albidovulum sp.]